MKDPTVSLCMIVKNEEKDLQDCLRTVRDLVDQMIIVDTGSTDATVEIARSNGASVHHFPWIGDFAAARNESVRHATGDWVFWMDADERLNCCGIEDCLRSAAAIEGIEAYLVPISSQRRNGASGFHYAIRFFKNIPGVSFEGEVHESVSPFMEKIGANTVPAAFLIEHLGYAIESEQMRQKLQRNLDLLQKTMERNPQSAFARYYYGLTLMVADPNRQEEAVEALRSALEGADLTPNIRALTLNTIAHYHLQRREFDLALECTRESLECVPLQNSARLLTGIAHYNRQDYAKALPYLFFAYQHLHLPPERRRTGISKEDTHDEVDILRSISICYAQLQQYSQAVAFFHRYLQHRPEDAEASRYLGICYLNCQDWASALKHLKNAEALGGDALDLAFPLAYACLEHGQITEALRYFSSAIRGRFENEETTLFKKIVSFCFERNLIAELITFLEGLAEPSASHSLILDALGIACIKAGNLVRAIEVHEALHESNPADLLVTRRLAALHLKLGDVDSAEKYLSIGR